MATPRRRARVVRADYVTRLNRLAQWFDERLASTAREAAAVEAQRTRWNAVRRLVRLAARREPALAALLAAC